MEEIAWTRRAGDPKIYYHDLKAWNPHDLRADLPRITCPDLLVWGKEDYFVPYELVKETLDGIPNARLEALEGIGHYPDVEPPDFNIVVERFLNSVVGQFEKSKV